MAKLKSEIEVQCPCCNALLVVDANLGRIISHKEPERGDKPELNEATRILAEEARRREALFEQSVEAEKTRGDALSRRFEEALRQAKEEGRRWQDVISLWHGQTAAVRSTGRGAGNTSTACTRAPRGTRGT